MCNVIGSGFGAQLAEDSVLRRACEICRHRPAVNKLEALPLRENLSPRPGSCS